MALKERKGGVRLNERQACDENEREKRIERSAGTGWNDVQMHCMMEWKRVFVRTESS